MNLKITEYINFLLLNAGIDQKQAKAIVSGFSQFHQSDVTKEHLK